MMKRSDYETGGRRREVISIQAVFNHPRVLQEKFPSMERL
jgi:hypothetical protein